MSRSQKSDKTGSKGNILASLRRSPLVGANLDLSRPFDAGRKAVDKALLEAFTDDLSPQTEDADSQIRSMRDNDRY